MNAGEWSNSAGDTITCETGHDIFGRPCLLAVTRRKSDKPDIAVTLTVAVDSDAEFVELATRRGFAPN